METNKYTLTGKVRKYIPWNRDSNRGGYGFIKGNDGIEYFFNAKYSSLSETDIKEGKEVKFSLRKGFDKKRGEFVLQATKVCNP
ncbi:cold shock domain-containing protein [Leptospira stimsonii]|uniref:Cold-shock protein n=1 Tax=Leptospira stimsonii TaxID=2202203 RepID=A0A8B3CHT5_9LEPT|nr:cold shock domain-containing protein [Leptospira stimsonii]RHX83256.1 cold-shock protein [Leptospira stimsonii]